MPTRRRWLIVPIAFVPLAVAVALLSGRPRLPDTTGNAAGGITVVDAAHALMVPPARARLQSLAPPSDPRMAPAVIASQIASTIDAPASTLRNVRLVDAGGTMACGERIVGGTAYYRRFVWIKAAGLVATDDGGPDFANLAKACGK